MPAPGDPKVVFTYAFTDRPGGGTHVEIRIGKATGKDKLFLDAELTGLSEMIEAMVAPFRSILEGKADTPVEVEEPTPPVSAERFLTEPVHTH
jgi:hypothetical protein